VTLSQKLVATEAELRDALIRMESLQRDVTRQVERENAMEKTCRQLESQVEQMRSDKSVIYHQAREQVIMGYAAEAGEPERNIFTVNPSDEIASCSR
jgi:predicted Holliday junction resolvase-like endonuclease